MEPKKCEHCGERFLPKYRVTQAYWAKRRFCSDACREQGHHPPSRTGATTPLTERLWSKVDRTGANGCWLWTGTVDGCGYGMLYRSRNPVRWWKAHRLAYELTHGEVPAGLSVLHRCDTPACVNPDHLWLGTHQDNMRDRDEKGRGGGLRRSGERNGRSRLTDAEALRMREMYRLGGVTQAQLSRQFGCSEGHVSRIVNGVQRLGGG